jgi:hypothetical protein
VLTNKILKPRIRVFASGILEVDIGVVHVLEVMLHCASSAVHHGLFTAQPWERDRRKRDRAVEDTVFRRFNLLTEVKVKVTIY